MEIKRRHWLAVALLSVLLVNLESSQAHSIQDSLPSLVVDDENINAGGEKLAPGDSPAKVEPLEAKKSAEDVSGGEPAKDLAKVVPFEVKSSEVSSAGVNKAPEVEPTKQQVAESSGESLTSQKSATIGPTLIEEPIKPKPNDINVLLANKNDDENDLNGIAPGAKPVASPTELEESKPTVEVYEDKKGVELDSPVDVNGSHESGNNDRFHYSVGQPQVKEKETPVTENSKESRVPETSTEAPREKPAETTQSSSSASAALPEEKETKKVDINSPVEGKEVVSDDKVNPTVEESLAPEKLPEPAASPSSPVSEPSSTSLAPPSTSTSTSERASEASTEKPKSEVSEAPTSVVNTKTEKSKESPSSKAPEVLSPSSISPVGEKATTEKAPNVPSVLAVALGTALGAAVQPILQASKPVEKPLVVGAASSTTSKPAVRSTPKKSSVDRWDLWTPSTGSSSTTTTTGSPSTRRRPILPSIRRRFRPYNRFSPFPWAGVDSYSPAGGETEFMAPAEPASSVGSTAGKPRRRSSTTEPPKSSTSSTRDDDEDDEVPALGSTPSSRRRNPNGNKRRHHQHHHRHSHHHRRYHSDERPPYSEPGTFEPPMGPRPHFGGGSSPGGFGLYSPSSTFDLLNPFSGWLDPLTGSSNKPNRAQSPRPPIGSRPPPPAGSLKPVEGEFNEPEHYHHHRDEHHHGRPHGSREDYDDHPHDHHDHNDHHDHHDHHHDCRDYDHHHRPMRPAREPYRPGDYDTYPPSSGPYGGRPNRPYNRQREPGSPPDTTIVRDNAEFSSRQSPVGPRRVPSIFSPFESLFGTLDDELFGLRSSFLDAPLKAAASEPGSQHFDAVITSPKISLPSVSATSPEAAKELIAEPHKHLAASEATRNGPEIDNKHVVDRRNQRERVV